MLGAPQGRVAGTKRRGKVLFLNRNDAIIPYVCGSVSIQNKALWIMFLGFQDQANTKSKLSHILTICSFKKLTKVCQMLKRFDDLFPDVSQMESSSTKCSTKFDKLDKAKNKPEKCPNVAHAL